MKIELLKIAQDLEQGTIDLNTARNLLLGLFDVIGSLPSDELIRERGEGFEAKTYYNLGEGEYIGDFEIGAKWVVDYFLGNDS
jgi:hypothetical protein